MRGCATVGRLAAVVAALALALPCAGCGRQDAHLGPLMERALSEALGVPVSMAKVEVDRLGGVLTAADVTIGDGAGGQLARADTLVVRGALDLDGFDPREIELGGAVIELHVVDGSVAGLPAPPSKGGNGTDDDATRRLTLTDARVIVHDGPLRVELSAAELAATRGPDGRVTAALTGGAAVVHHAGRSHPLPRVEGRGRWNAGRLDIARGTIAGPGFELGVTDGIVGLPLGSRLEGQVQGRLELAQLAGLLTQHPDLTKLAPLAGVVKVRGRPQWREGAATGQLELSAERLKIAGVNLGPRSRVVVRAAGGALHIRGDIPGATAGTDPRASLEASVTLQHGAPMTAKVSFEDGSLTEFAALVDRIGVEFPSLEADVGGTVTLAGALHPLAVAGPAQLVLQRVHAPRANPDDTPNNTPNDTPGLSALTLRAQVVATAGDVQLQDMRIEAGHGTVIGPLTVTSAGARVVLDDDGQGLRLRALHVEGRGLALRSEEVVLDRRTGELLSPAVLQVGRIAVAQLGPLLGDWVDLTALHVEGTATGSATVTGSALEPDSVQLALALVRPRLLDVQFDAGTLQLTRSAGGATELNALTLERSGGRAHIAGTLGGPSAQAGLQVALEALPLVGVLGLSAGRLSGSGRLLQADRSRDRMQLSAVGLVRNGSKLGDAQLTVPYQPSGHSKAAECPRAAEAWGAEPRTGAWLVCGGGLGGSLRVDLAVGDDTERTTRGTLALRDLGLSPWLPAPLDGTDGSAVVTVQADVRTGGLSAPETLGGVLRFERLSLDYAGVGLEAEAPFQAPMARGRVQLGDAVLVGTGARLALRGHGSLAGELDLGAEGSLRADRLLGLSSWADRAEGQVAVALDVSGPVTEPVFAATLSPRNATVKLSPGGLWVRGVTGDVSLDSGQLRVEQLGGEVAGGTVRLDGVGRVVAGRLQQYDLTLTARGLEVEPDAQFDVAFEADVTIRSEDGERARWRGDVRVARLMYARRIPLYAALRALGAGQRQTASKRASGPRVEFDLRLLDLGPLRIRNDVLDTELKAPQGLRLVGTDDNLGLIGQVQLDGGRVMFRGDDFQVTRGTLTFDGEHHMVPRLDVSGRAAARKRAAASIVFEAKSDGQRVGVTVRCEPSPGDDLGVPPPFSCGSVGDRLDCGDFDALLSLWLCQPPLAAGPASDGPSGEATLATR